MNFINNLVGPGLTGKLGDHAILKGHNGPVASCKFSADHAILATCGDQTLRILNASTGKLERCWRHQRDMSSVDISSDLSFIACGSIGGSVFVYDNRTRSLFASWVAAEEWTAPWVYFMNDSRYLLTIAGEEAKIWAIKEKRVIAAWGGPEAFSAAVSKGCKMLATGSASGTIFVRALPEGHVLKIFLAHGAEIYALAFSPLKIDGSSLLCSGSCDAEVRIWDTRTWACLHVMQGHQREIYKCIFSSDGARVATCSQDKTIRVWDVKNGTELKCLKHGSEVFCCTWADAGKTDVVAGGCKDGTTHVWRMTN
jgi:WD40 repeat protein